MNREITPATGPQYRVIIDVRWSRVDETVNPMPTIKSTFFPTREAANAFVRSIGNIAIIIPADAPQVTDPGFLEYRNDTDYSFRIAQRWDDNFELDEDGEWMIRIFNPYVLPLPETVGGPYWRNGHGVIGDQGRDLLEEMGYIGEDGGLTRKELRVGPQPGMTVDPRRRGPDKKPRIGAKNWGLDKEDCPVQ